MRLHFNRFYPSPHVQSLILAPGAPGKRPPSGVPAAQSLQTPRARVPGRDPPLHQIWFGSEHFEIFASWGPGEGRGRAVGSRGRGGFPAGGAGPACLPLPRKKHSPRNFFVSGPISTKLGIHGLWVPKVPPTKFENDPTTLNFSVHWRPGKAAMGRALPGRRHLAGRGSWPAPSPGKTQSQKNFCLWTDFHQTRHTWSMGPCGTAHQL